MRAHPPPSLHPLCVDGHIYVCVLLVPRVWLSIKIYAQCVIYTYAFCMLMHLQVSQLFVYTLLCLYHNVTPALACVVLSYTRCIEEVITCLRI